MSKYDKSTVLLTLLVLFLGVQHLKGQVTTDSTETKKYQAKAPPTQAFGAEAFEPSDKTNDGLAWGAFSSTAGALP